MAWTYDPTEMLDATAGAYAGSTIGLRTQVRFAIQDTQTAEQLLADEEIDWLLCANASDVPTVSALSAEAIASKYAREVDMAGASINARASQLFAQYTAMGKRLRVELAKGAGVYAGGMSLSEKTSDRGNTDLPQPAFFRGMQDDPRIPNSSDPDLESPS